MTRTSFETYRSARLAEGFDEVAERVWPADSVAETHTHPFAVQALVVQGEMWLTVGGQTRHLQPGDRFDLARELPHAERYGPAGATYWAARRYAINSPPCTSPRHQTPSSGPTAEGAPPPP